VQVPQQTMEPWSHFGWRCASLYSQQLLQLMFFSFHIKMHFPFFRWPEGSKQVLFCEGATKGSVQNITTLIFMAGGPTRGATSSRLGIISAYCYIMNYFFPKSILIEFCTGATRNTHHKNWGKIYGGPLGVWNPRTKTKPWFSPHLADINGTVSLT
jgi:hypothetical protein